MSSEVETSRDETNRYCRGILRLRCVSLRITTTLQAGIVFAFACVFAALAQEPPTTTPLVPSEESPALSISPEGSPTPSPVPEQTPSVLPGRSVRISFIPPPIEGTISLGIYDNTGKLVRVLHQEAKLNEFTIGADALITQWDGKNDEDEDLPAGKYHAHGYLVGPLQAEPMSNSNPPSDATPTATVRVRLAPNPLAKNRRQTIELVVRFNEDGSYLETVDRLPLFTIDEKPGLTGVVMKKSGQNSLDVWEEGGGPVVQFRVANLDKMMAFDCGEFELK